MADFSMNDLSPYVEGLVMTEGLQDWDQTRHFLKNSENHETNPVLGPHPSIDKMTAFGAAGLGLQYGGYKLLPDNYKLPYAGAFAIAEGAQVYHNKKQFDTPWNVPLLGLGGLVTAALAADWNRTHKDKKLSPYFDLGGASGKTPVMGLTMQW